ncbi:MAG: hypothetical protein HPY61_14545, partial [Methanotrichaceae archaeon]|nr:hypothetical protein [Methanotrichaceae archaeon]
MSGQSACAYVDAGYKDGLYASTKSDFKNGGLIADQSARSDGISANAYQTSSIDAESGSVSAVAQSHDGSRVSTEIGVSGGILTAEQEANAGNFAFINDISHIIGDGGFVTASAEDANGNRVEIIDSATMSHGTFDSIKETRAEIDNTYLVHYLDVTKAITGSALSSAQTSGGDVADASEELEQTDGSIKTYQNLKADGIAATVSHDTLADQVNSASIRTYAVDSDGNQASTSLDMGGMASGDYANIMDLEADGSATISHDTWADQVGSTSVSTYIVDSNDNQASTSLGLSGMASGEFTNIMDLKADGSASISHDTWANRLGSANTGAYALDSEGNLASTSLDLGGISSGDFVNTLNLEADDGATVYHDTWADRVGSASVITNAVDSDGNYAITSLDLGGMASGAFTNIMDLETDGSAAISHDTWADQVGSASVITNAVDSDGKRSVTSLDLGGMASGDFTNI